MAALNEPDPTVRIFIFKFTFKDSEGHIEKTIGWKSIQIYPGTQGWEALREGRRPLGDYLFSRLNVDVNSSWVREDEIEPILVGKGTKQDIQKALKQMGKPVSGNKKELCERLANAKISSKNDQDITTFYTVSGAAAEEPQVPPPDELKEHISSGENCGICMEKLEGAEVTVLPCGHKLRTECYDNLMIVREFTDEFGCRQVTKQECPICRLHQSCGYCDGRLCFRWSSDEEPQEPTTRTYTWLNLHTLV